MPKLDHQATELVNAITQVINTEETKAKLAVFNIIKTGHENADSPYQILTDILTWVGK